MKTVLVSGCWDVLHGGHVQFLTDAAALGDRLVVTVAGPTALAQNKGRLPAMPTEHKVEVLRALRCVDDVIVTRSTEIPGMDFVPYLSRVRPDILAVTTDDAYATEKKSLCKDRGIEYRILTKWLDYEPVSTTLVRRRCAAPAWSPLRVDFGGGWLDVPKLAREDSFIVNCAVTPGITLTDNWPEPGSGLGGSAAWAMINGHEPVNFELKSGVGWQDPAVIVETGLCVWRSGYRPVLECKCPGRWLAGLMAIRKTEGHHRTVELVNAPRNYNLIVAAGRLGLDAVRHQSLDELARTIQLTSRMHLDEGMLPLMTFGEIASKYCGSGYGGYALYLFATRAERDAFVSSRNGIAIEPYDRWRGVA
ncbi:MAG TPA: adenylyltransferase/cytidyltransferase family protein [Phycisphaerae bacterium]|nr:adenylyltransferase/cytidyltransferase family protein [Phycisphaerae bacterium]